jgi:predicted aldo/keto reductase-like oxidoreductase
MIYKDFQNIKLPSLGFGAMRLPTTGNEWDSPIDEAAAEKMVAYAMENGANYFDTAWGYHNGQSETAIGKLLGAYPRDSWFLADKFPGYDLSNMDKAKDIFEEQLKRCGVGYFDFYMFHNVCEMNIDASLDEKYGIFDYLKKQKEAGRIRHLGFSTHGDLHTMVRFLEAYGGYMEFCQIQLNYVDWSLQNAKSKAGLLNEYNIPIWVMEPMRGGSLASLPENDAAKLKLLRPDETIPAWAFRYLQAIPNITVILSGASTLGQLQENIKVFDTEKPLTFQELHVLHGIADGMIDKIALPCTACGYCAALCPKQLDIPNLLNLYNEHCYTANTGLMAFIAPMALAAMPEEKRPGACTACGNCEAVCPQKIKIKEAMADFADKVKI